MNWDRHPAIQRAADLMWNGGIIAYPTEAVWGLGCAPDNADAVYKLLMLKKRDIEKGLILVAADEDMLAPYLAPLSSEQRATLSASWPGPNTWLIPDVNDLVPEWIKGQYSSVAFRVTANPLVAGLCRAYGGPIVSTSANPQGLAPAMHQWKVRRYFGDNLSMITPGAVGGNAKPSVIRDLLTGQTIRA